MDNHQLEIAEEMESQGFLVHATLGYGIFGLLYSNTPCINRNVICRSVAEAVEKIDTMELRQWPPGPSLGSAYQKGGLWEAINELMPQ